MTRGYGNQALRAKPVFDSTQNYAMYSKGWGYSLLKSATEDIYRFSVNDFGFLVDFFVP
jgi:hypothetical protein